jgi:hypothetical protein
MLAVLRSHLVIQSAVAGNKSYLLLLDLTFVHFLKSFVHNAAGTIVSYLTSQDDRFSPAIDFLP